MSLHEQIKLFEEAHVRSVYDDVLEQWFFSIVDIIKILTDSDNPTDYLKKMRKRDTELGSFIGTNCPQILMTTATGLRRKTLAATPEQVFRIIQSIPSKKAEPFKQWMAHVAAERLLQMQDPERNIDQMIADYHRLGYSNPWINQRIKSIEVRKEFTDELDRAGITEQKDYAFLTSILTKEWSGKSVKEYKQHKGLKQESLRDNMTNVELALNTLAEASATEIAQQRNPQGMQQATTVVKQGGSVAKAARLQLEKQLGHSVVSPLKASDYLKPIESADSDGDKDKFEDNTPN